MAIGTLEDIHILTYGRNEFTEELIRKHNKIFEKTAAGIPENQKGQEVQLSVTKRAALTTTIWEDPTLRSSNVFPITPQESEELLQVNRLPNLGGYWEDLGLTLRLPKGQIQEDTVNPKESLRLYNALEEDLKIGLFKNPFTNETYSLGILTERILVVNPGFVPDPGMPLGGYFTVLHGLTQIYPHPIFQREEREIKFEGYGLEFGLPFLNQLDKGDRNVYPPKKSSTGLMVLGRDGDLGLGARDEGIAFSGSAGWGIFAQRAKKI